MACRFLLLSASLLIQVWIGIAMKTQATMGTGNPEAILWNNLTRNYLSNVRPSVHPNDSVTVEVSVTLAYIGGLNEKQQTMNSFGWVRMSWLDPGLSWNPLEYEDLRYIVVPSRMLWLPEISVLNAINDLPELNLLNHFRASIYHTGRVIWAPSVHLRTACSFDLTYFPMDHQICHIKFTHWMYESRALNLTFSADYAGDIIAQNFTTDGEWSLVDSGMWRSLASGIEDSSYTVLGITLHLRRRPRFYLLNIVFPFVVLSLLASTIFLIPPTSGEKISFGINTMVSFSVLFMFIMDIMPKSGEFTPMLATFAYACLGQSTAGMILTTITMNIYHRKPSVPVPRWLDRVVRGCLVKLIHMSPYDEDGDWSRTSTARRRKSSTSNIHILKNALTSQYDLAHNCPSLSSLDFLNVTRGLPETGEFEHHEMSSRTQKDSLSWKAISRILDRTFFCVSFCTYAIYTSFFFISLNSQPEHIMKPH